MLLPAYRPRRARWGGRPLRARRSSSGPRRGCRPAGRSSRCAGRPPGRQGGGRLQGPGDCPPRPRGGRAAAPARASSSRWWRRSEPGHGRVRGPSGRGRGVRPRSGGGRGRSPGGLGAAAEEQAIGENDPGSARRRSNSSALHGRAKALAWIAGNEASGVLGCGRGARRTTGRGRRNQENPFIAGRSGPRPGACRRRARADRAASAGPGRDRPAGRCGRPRRCRAPRAHRRC